jgi:hypothetical protein
MLSRKIIAYDRTPNDRHPVFTSLGVLRDARNFHSQTASRLAIRREKGQSTASELGLLGGWLV